MYNLSLHIVLFFCFWPTTIFAIIKDSCEQKNMTKTREILMLKSNISALIFDIDGTLWDAAEPSAAALQKVADEQNLDIQITPDIIRSISGTPCVEALQKVFGPNYNENLKERLDIAERTYIEKAGGTIYPDVLEVLNILKNKYKLFLVSNCDSWYLKLSILDLKTCL